MRVSHSGTSNVKILEVFKHFWPALEPCKLRTNRVMGSIFSVPALHTRTYPPYSSQSMDMHSLATLVCQIWVNYRWNMEIAGQNVLIWGGSIKRLDLQTTYRYRAKHFRIYFYWRGLPYLGSCKVWEYASQSPRDLKRENSWNFQTFLTCIGAL